MHDWARRIDTLSDRQLHLPVSTPIGLSHFARMPSRESLQSRPQLAAEPEAMGTRDSKLQIRMLNLVYLCMSISRISKIDGRGWLAHCQRQKILVGEDVFGPKNFIITCSPRAACYCS